VSPVQSHLRLLLALCLICALAPGCPDTGDDDVEQIPGVDDDDDDSQTDDDDADVPERCQATCDAVYFDDGEPLLPVAPLDDGDLRLLLVRSALLDSNDPQVRSLTHHLSGLGVPYVVLDTDSLSFTDLAGTAAVLVIDDPWYPALLDADTVARLSAAVADGTDILWLGTGLPPDLGATFGVQVGDLVETSEAGVTDLRFTDSTGADVELPVFDDLLNELTLDGAEAVAAFLPGEIPAATVHRPADGAGRTVLVPFGLMHYWGEEREDFAWARAELLSELVGLVQSGGGVYASPFPDGYGGAFLVRFEDLHPGGSRFWLHDDWMDQYERVTAELDDWQIPLNLGVVARYVDPTYGEHHTWDTDGEDRARLRHLLQDDIDAGADLICHGWTHQYGTGEDDYTGVDWEFSDDGSGDWEFLPYAEQEERILAARDELEAAFGVVPPVWETPHLDGNEDTYLAASAAGFAWVNESDGFLYPNRWGEDDVMGGNVLNVPHTGSYMPNDDPADYADQSLTWVMPRLTRVRAPFFLYYHNYSIEQEEALYAMAECAHACDLWRPRVSDLATWWELRDDTTLTATRAADGSLSATVTDAPAGLTLVFRMPDGVEASSVTVDGSDTAWQAHRRGGVEYVRVVLGSAMETAGVQVQAAAGG